MAILIEADTLPELKEKIAEMEKEGYSVRGKIVYTHDKGTPIVAMNPPSC